METSKEENARVHPPCVQSFQLWTHKEVPESSEGIFHATRLGSVGAGARRWENFCYIGVLNIHRGAGSAFATHMHCVFG